MIEQTISTSETMQENPPKNAFQNAKNQIHRCIVSRSRVNSEVRPKWKRKERKRRTVVRPSQFEDDGDDEIQARHSLRSVGLESPLQVFYVVLVTVGVHQLLVPTQPLLLGFGVFALTLDAGGVVVGDSEAYSMMELAVVPSNGIQAFGRASGGSGWISRHRTPTIGETYQYRS